MKKYVRVFGNLFDDLQVVRKTSTGVNAQVIQVPIAYGSKEQWWQLVHQKPDLIGDQRTNTPVPRMAFEIVGWTPDRSRAIVPIQYNVHVEPGHPSMLRHQFVQVPYNIDFALYILTNNTDDAAQITENILPYFQPDLTITMVTVPEMARRDDMVLVMGQPGFSDTYDQALDGRRDITWTIPFTLRGYMYGPVSKQGIIKRAQIDFHAVRGSGPITDAEIESTPRTSRLLTTPGLTANGHPTTKIEESVAYLTIDPDDDYGFVERKFVYDDGKHYDSERLRDVPVVPAPLANTAQSMLDLRQWGVGAPPRT